MAPSFQEHHQPIINNWTLLARKFADKFLDVYTSESVTPYMHVFIYHVEHFLRHVGPIELFANYDIESWHKINKTTMKHMTSGFGGRNKTPCNLTAEQLHASIRLKEHLKKFGKKLPTRKNWTSEYVDESEVLHGNKELEHVLEQIEIDKMQQEIEDADDYYFNICELQDPDASDKQQHQDPTQFPIEEDEIITILLELQHLPL